jgi:hypothetical protein
MEADIRAESRLSLCLYGPDTGVSVVGQRGQGPGSYHGSYANKTKFDYIEERKRASNKECRQKKHGGGNGENGYSQIGAGGFSYE